MRSPSKEVVSGVGSFGGRPHSGRAKGRGMPRTDSINEAAFAVTRGLPHPSFEWVTDKLCVFEFIEDARADKFFREYKEGGTVEARAFASTLAHLKTAMFRSKS